MVIMMKNWGIFCMVFLLFYSLISWWTCKCLIYHKLRQGFGWGFWISAHSHISLLLIQEFCHVQFWFLVFSLFLNLLGGWWVWCMHLWAWYPFPYSNFLFVKIQAKMGMTEDFEASLQVLRGFDTDISIEVNEIKVNQNNYYVFF